MAKIADRFMLGVSPLTGDAYITATDKSGLMTDNRRKLSRNEVLSFIHQWAQEESRRLDDDTIMVTAGGKTILEIKIKK